MRALSITISILLFCVSTNLNAQSSESEISKEFYKADAQLSIILHYLPENWSFSTEGDLFIISCKDSAWVLSENRINAPMEKKEVMEARVKQFGKKVMPRIVIEYHEKWDADKIQLSAIKNAAIDDEVRELPEKYHITGLLDSALSGKFGAVYTPKNDKDRKLLQQYENERENLLKKKIVMPDFHSEKYSLFIREISAVGDEMHTVVPEQISMDVYTILSTFREVCGK